MKKLRMIVTFVIVFAIVGSAYAFNAKKVHIYCVDTAPFDNNCNGTISARYITTQGGTQFRTYANCNWDGRLSTCTGPNCTTDVRLALNAE